MADEEIVVEESQELAVREPAPPTLFGTADPAEVIVRATAAAAPLAEVVRKQKLTSNIKGKEHVRVEGWTLLGSMLGVFPVCVWSRRLEQNSPEDPVGWEARVEARTRDGAIVGAAEAMCSRSESTWASRDDYALRSMAQTRATSKAMRQPLGFVMQLAGFEVTPAEEMPPQPPQSHPNAAPPPAPSSVGPQTWEDIQAFLSLHVDMETEWLAAASQAMYGKPPADLEADEKRDYFQRMLNVCDLLGDEDGPEGEERVRGAFAAGFDGAVLDVKYAPPTPF